MKRNENASHLKRPSDRNPPRRGGPRPPPPLPPPPPPLPLAFEEAFSSKGFPPVGFGVLKQSQSLVCRRRRFFFVVFFSFVFFSFFFETEKFFEKKILFHFYLTKKDDDEDEEKTRDVWAGSLMSRGGAETGGLLLSGGPFRSAFEFGCATPNERHPLFLLRVSLLSFLFRFREVRSFLSRARVLLFVGLFFFCGFY